MTTVATDRDVYIDVQADFIRLRGIDANSPEFARLRTSIIERCVPLADHIARRYDRRGITHDDDGPTLSDRLGQHDPGLRFIEDREALRMQLATLPQRHRDIVLMRFFECLTQTQIAERIGISQMHVSRLLVQSLSALRDGMNEKR